MEKIEQFFESIGDGILLVAETLYDYYSYLARMWQDLFVYIKALPNYISTILGVLDALLPPSVIFLLSAMFSVAIIKLIVGRDS